MDGMGPRGVPVVEWQMSFLVKLALIVGVVVMCIPADPAELARAMAADTQRFAQVVKSAKISLDN